MKQIAKDLAFGCSTSEVANKYGVTPGRISQLRRTLEESWVAFQAGAGSGTGITPIYRTHEHRVFLNCGRRRYATSGNVRLRSA